MSDKPIPAEVVRADQIRVGDRLRHRRYTITVDETYPLKMVDTGSIKQIIRYRHPDGLASVSWRAFPDTEVYRVLPEPVEVRDFWRATVHAGEDGDQVYDDLAWNCNSREECIETAAKTCKNVRQESATIEHVRETIISREEVQP